MAPQAFEQLLRFLYTDECEEDAVQNMADHLLVAATRWCMGMGRGRGRGMHVSPGTHATSTCARTLLLNVCHHANVLKVHGVFWQH